MKTDNNPPKESIFLNENLMSVTCIFVVITSIISFIIVYMSGDSFTIFDIVVKLVTSIAMYLAFRHYNWDVTKGLLGGVLFCLMYQEAYLVFARLWGEEDFDTYLVAGVQGSLYLAAAGMSFLMTIIIAINHFFINYAKHGNPENVILNRMAIGFKFAVYILLLIANSRLDFAPVILWKNAFWYLTDMSIILLVVCIESQLDSFKVLHHELLTQKRQKEEVK